MNQRTSIRDASPPLLLYDGACGFCTTSVRFILRFEPPGARLLFASLEAQAAENVVRDQPRLRTIDSLVWQAAGETLVFSDAVIAALRYLGGPWNVLGVALEMCPRPWRDGLYKIVARHRRSLCPAKTCTPLRADQRIRFLL